MKIQQQNSYNPNMKALYFTKVIPSISKTIKYKNQIITESGIKYVEDNSERLTPMMKEALRENSVIKNLAEKYETFVQYMGEKYNISWGMFNSDAHIHVIDSKKNERCVYSFSAKDKYTPEGARVRLLADIESGLTITEKTWPM